MKLISWNVNSINVRFPLVLHLLKKHTPDVVFLQETKCEDHRFPYEALDNTGYNILHVGQKTFNGVAILSKYPFDEKHVSGLPHFNDDQKRYIEVVIQGISFINVYAPHGKEPMSESYDYKLRFFDHLYRHLETYTKHHQSFVIAGDFNVALREEDSAFHDSSLICLTVQERQKLNQLLQLGLIDAQVYKHVDGYTWWDYRGQGFKRNLGMRLDYILVAPGTFKTIDHFEIDLDIRREEKPSDHAPIVMIAR